MRRYLTICLVSVAVFVTSAGAQTGREAVLRAQWERAVNVAAQERGLTVSAGVIARAGGAATDAQKAQVYKAAVERLLADPLLRDIFTPDEALVRQTTPPDESQWIRRLAESGAGEKGAKALNAASTNPRAPKVAERSGFTDLLALALDSQNFVVADKTAVSLNLNALALVGLGSETLSAPEAYRRHDAIRRLGGTVTFGAKVPEKEITGLSGVPTADTLLDAFSWDVKVRAIGDRDPRAQRWYRFMLGDLGGLGEILASLGALVPESDLPVLTPVLNDRLGLAVADVKRRLSRSLQVSVKAAGQHLTAERGKNKYSFAVLGDQGFGDTDLTFNVLYSSVNDVSVAPASALFTVKTWSGAVALNTLVAEDVLVTGRATELSLNAKVEIPVDNSALPLERTRVWNVVGAVTMPWGDVAKIPVSIAFTNDANNFKKAKYVTGYVGVSYDFGALKSLFKPQAK